MAYRISIKGCMVSCDTAGEAWAFIRALNGHTELKLREAEARKRQKYPARVRRVTQGELRQHDRDLVGRDLLEDREQLVDVHGLQRMSDHQAYGQGEDF